MTPPSSTGSFGRFALIVDDDISTREILMHYMRKLEYGSVLAHDGLSAIDVPKTAHVDLIISDLEMPGMNGLELIRALRAGPQWMVPLIVISGNERMMDAARPMVNAMLLKPIRFAMLESTVRYAAGGAYGK